MKSTDSSKKIPLSSWQNSNCSHGWLHRFSIVAEYEEGVLERCQLCSKEVFFPIINGQSNNEMYVAFHVRQCLPPYHELFSHEYPI